MHREVRRAEAALQEAKQAHEATMTLEEIVQLIARRTQQCGQQDFPIVDNEMMVKVIGR